MLVALSNVQNLRQHFALDQQFPIFDVIVLPPDEDHDRQHDQHERQQCQEDPQDEHFLGVLRKFDGRTVDGPQIVTRGVRPGFGLVAVASSGAVAVRFGVDVVRGAFEGGSLLDHFDFLDHRVYRERSGRCRFDGSGSGGRCSAGSGGCAVKGDYQRFAGVDQQGCRTDQLVGFLKNEREKKEYVEKGSSRKGVL